MSDDSPNDAGYQLVKDMQDREEHTRRFGSPYPKHTGPQVGPNDFMLGGLLLGMTWGLLDSGGDILWGVLGGLIGGAAGAALKFVLLLPFRVLGWIINAGKPRAETQTLRKPQTYASDSIDWEAKRRAKYGKK